MDPKSGLVVRQRPLAATGGRGKLKTINGFRDVGSSGRRAALKGRVTHVGSLSGVGFRTAVRGQGQFEASTSTVLLQVFECGVAEKPYVYGKVMVWPGTHRPLSRLCVSRPSLQVVRRVPTSDNAFL
jgi:hypothetical protein